MNFLLNSLKQISLIFLFLPIGAMQKDLLDSVENIVAQHKKQRLLNNRDDSINNKKRYEEIVGYTNLLIKYKTKKFHNLVRDSCICLIFFTSFVFNRNSYKKSKVSFGGICFVNITSLGLLLDSLMNYYKAHTNLELLKQMVICLGNPIVTFNDPLR